MRQGEKPDPSGSFASSTGGTSPRKETRAPITCLPCRMAKIKCSKTFPCERCVRLNLECEDPNSEKAAENIQAPCQVLMRVIKSRKRKHHHATKSSLATNQTVPLKNHQRLRYLRRSFGLVVRRKTGDEHAAALCEVLDELLGRENETEEGEGAVKRDEGGEASSGHHHHSSSDDHLDLTLADVPMAGPLKHNAANPDEALHPFLLALNTEAHASISLVIINGQRQFYTNNAFARMFFTDEEANKKVLDDNVLPSAIMTSVVEPKDRPLLEPVMDFMLFQTPDETCEAFQVLKCRLQGGVVSLCILRVRVVVAYEGNYFGITMALTPMPLPSCLFDKRSTRKLQQPLCFSGKFFSFPPVPASRSTGGDRSSVSSRSETSTSAKKKRGAKRGRAVVKQEELEEEEEDESAMVEEEEEEEEEDDEVDSLFFAQEGLMMHQTGDGPIPSPFPTVSELDALLTADNTAGGMGLDPLPIHSWSDMAQYHPMMAPPNDPNPNPPSSWQQQLPPSGSYPSGMMGGSRMMMMPPPQHSHPPSQWGGPPPPSNTSSDDSNMWPYPSPQQQQQQQQPPRHWQGQGGQMY